MVKNKKPIFIFSQIWQLIELAGLLFSIPMFFLFGILFTGDSYTVIDFVNSYVITTIAIFFFIKIIAFIAFTRLKPWAIYFNLIQNLILTGIIIILLILTISSDAFSISQVLFLLLFLLLSWVNYRCLKAYKAEIK